MSVRRIVKLGCIDKWFERFVATETVRDLPHRACTRLALLPFCGSSFPLPPLFFPLFKVTRPRMTRSFRIKNSIARTNSDSKLSLLPFEFLFLWILDIFVRLLEMYILNWIVTLSNWRTVYTKTSLSSEWKWLGINFKKNQYSNSTLLKLKFPHGLKSKMLFLNSITLVISFVMEFYVPIGYP